MRPDHLARPAALALLLLVGLSACAVEDVRESLRPATPEPMPSVREGEPETDPASAALDAFLVRMADPEATYRVRGSLTVGPQDAEGAHALEILTAYDVSGDDYAGQVRVGGTILPGPHLENFDLVALDGTTQVWTDAPDSWTVDTPDAARRPNALEHLNAGDLTFVGLTDDGLFEFDVEPWIGGDPIGEWSAIAAFDEAEMPATTIDSHRSRLTIDRDGVPHTLTSAWTFTAEGRSEMTQGDLVEAYYAMGLYVSIDEPRPAGRRPITSHSLSDEGVPSEFDYPAWFEIAPDPAGAARLDIEFGAPRRPVVLGIEGAVFFARSHAPDGSLILDGIISSEGDSIDIPSGEQTLVIYYRTCSGSCRLLDGPQDFCSIPELIQPDTDYVISVAIVDRDRADCTFEAVS